jgi:hypothetical protein
VGTVIRSLAVVASAIVVLGFLAFTVDELDKGSKTQQAQLDRELGVPEGGTITAVAPTPSEEAARERQHGSAREAIDDANDVLLGPFSDLVDSGNAWVQRGVPALLALLLYGVGLGMLANYLPKERHGGGDWRTASS